MKKYIAVSALLLSILTLIAQNSVMYTFDNNLLPSGFMQNGSYTLKAENQSLKVTVSKSDAFTGFDITFAGINLTEDWRKNISFNIKTDTSQINIPYKITTVLFSGTSPTPALTWREKTIYPSPHYRSISFNWSDNTTTTGLNIRGLANFAAINKMQIIVQPGNALSGNIYLDNIIIGGGNNPQSPNSSKTMPYFLGIANQTMLVNSPTKTLKILNPIGATGYYENITFSAQSSNPSLIPNPTFVNNTVPSNYPAPFVNALSIAGFLLNGTPALMQLSAVPNQSGMATITVSAISNSTVAGVEVVPSIHIFHVNVVKNMRPAADTILPQTIGSGTETIIPLTGVKNGNPESTQTVNITATSSDQSALSNSNIVVEYIPGANTAKIKVTPNSFGSLPEKNINLNITLTDDGGTAAGGNNTYTKTVPLIIYPALYKSPYFNPINNDDFAILNQDNTVTITGIHDGNGGANISMITAQSSNPTLIPSPSIIYKTGNNFAIMKYKATLIGSIMVTVTATNIGAPANSNGNSAFTRTFRISSVPTPITGYVEPFTNTKVYGSKYYSGGSNTCSETPSCFLQNGDPASSWLAEGQGNYQTLTVDQSLSKITIAMNKPGILPYFFAGVWYSAKNLMDLSANRYVSAKLRHNPASVVAIDLFDANGNRYGLSNYVTVTGTAQDFNFCFNGIADSPNFDFKKVSGILFNFASIRDASGGLNISASYNGTAELSDLRIGDQVLASVPGLCPNVIPTVKIPSLPTLTYLTNETGTKNVIIEGINAGSSPQTGLNTNPVTLTAVSSNPGLVPNPTVTSVTGGIATITLTTPASSGTAIITVTGTSSGSISSTSILTINIENAPASHINMVVDNNINSNLPDGQKGQTMDGFGATVYSNVSGGTEALNTNFAKFAQDMAMSIARVSVGSSFEAINDNNDPMSYNPEGFSTSAVNLYELKKYRDYGIHKFIAGVWSLPAFMKRNKSLVTANDQSFWLDNTVDTNFTAEVCEYVLAYCRKFKEVVGVDLYAFSFTNEPQYNRTYNSMMINPEQYKYLLKAIGKTLSDHNIPTLLMGPDTQVRANEDNEDNYLKAIQADAEAVKYLNIYAQQIYDASTPNPDQAAQPADWYNTKVTLRSNAAVQALNKYKNHPLSPANNVSNGGVGIQYWQTNHQHSGNGWADAMSMAGSIYNGLTFGNQSAWLAAGFGNGTASLFASDRPTANYYALMHFSKFVQPGAKRVPSVLSDINATLSGISFQNPDNTVSCILLNYSNTLRTVSIGGTNMPGVYRVFLSIANQYMTELSTTSGVVKVPANSIVTVWGGTAANVALASINVNVVSGSPVINTPGGVLTVTATLNPTNTTDKGIVWTSSAGVVVNNNGIVRALSNGIHTVTATSTKYPTISASINITVSGQITPIAGITVSGTAGASTIAVNNGTLQMIATLSPAGYTTFAGVNPVRWSVVNDIGVATISGTGLLTAYVNGIVTVVGTLASNPDIFSHAVITLSNQSASQILPTSITVYGGYGNTINIDKLPLQMYANFTPAITTNKAVIWSLINGEGTGTISGTGLLSPGFNGVVTVVGTSQAVPAVKGYALVTISGQDVPLIAFSFTGISNITTNKQSATMTPTFYPSGTINKNVIWSVISETSDRDNVPGGSGDIDINGVFRPYSNGTVTIVGIPETNTLLGTSLVVNVSGQGIRKVVIAPASTYTINITSDAILNYSAPITLLTAKVYPSYLPQNQMGVVWNIYTVSGDGNIHYVQDFNSTVSGLCTVTGIRNGIVNVEAISFTDANLSSNENVNVNVTSAFIGPSTVSGNTTYELPFSTITLSGSSINDYFNLSIIPSFHGTFDNDNVYNPVYAGYTTLAGAYKLMSEQKFYKVIYNDVSKVYPDSLSNVLFAEDKGTPLDNPIVSTDSRSVPFAIAINYYTKLAGRTVTEKQLTWTVSQDSANTVSNIDGSEIGYGNGIALKSGIATVTSASVVNSAAKTSVVLTISGVVYTHLKGMSTTNTVIYPNPAHQYITCADTHVNAIELYNLQGKKLKAYSNIHAMEKLYVGDIARGTYLLKIISGTSFATYKLVID
ncbi:MAG: T9SS type A sorting domain-containing protein [Cytophagales bacterium]|nr:T9SS type A sorting domain-containing protein [Cytophagales bacterium]